jgi:hypothetical protein
VVHFGKAEVRKRLRSGDTEPDPVMLITDPYQRRTYASS